MDYVRSIDFTWLIPVLPKNPDNKGITQIKNILQT